MGDVSTMFEGPEYRRVARSLFFYCCLPQGTENYLEMFKQLCIDKMLIIYRARRLIPRRQGHQLSESQNFKLPSFVKEKNHWILFLYERPRGQALLCIVGAFIYCNRKNNIF